MVAPNAGVEIENLRQFRAALRASQTGAEKELRNGLKAAGVPVVARAKVVAPMRTGALAAGYSVRVSGTNAVVANRVPYAAGAEWGRRGKWRGFLRYPAFGTGSAAGRGRFAWRAVVEERPQILAIITEKLREIIGLQGWARP